MFKNLSAMVVTLVVTLNGAYTHAQDVGKLVGESDQFFAAVGAGKVAPDQLLAEWTTEQDRLNQVAAAIDKQAPSLLHVKIHRRLGVTGIMLSKGKGSEPADGHFKSAEEILSTLNDAGGVPEYQEKLATLWKERADNLVLLGREDRALYYLDKALKAARASSYKDKLGEATIRERLAGVHFRKERWKEALDVINPSVAIMDGLKGQPGFDVEALRMPIWYQAISTSRLGNDAEPLFDKFLRAFDGKFTPHDEADVYREAAVNVGERAPKQAGPERTAALRKANSYILKAKQIIEKSMADEDAPEKVAILTDLGMSYARGGMGKEAEESFKAALETVASPRLSVAMIRPGSSQSFSVTRPPQRARPQRRCRSPTEGSPSHRETPLMNEQEHHGWCITSRRGQAKILPDHFQQEGFAFHFAQRTIGVWFTVVTAGKSTHPLKGTPMTELQVILSAALALVALAIGFALGRSTSGRRIVVLRLNKSAPPTTQPVCEASQMVDDGIERSDSQSRAAGRVRVLPKDEGTNDDFPEALAA